MKKFLNTFFKTLKINKSEVRLHLKDYFMHSKLLDVRPPVHKTIGSFAGIK